MNWSILIDEIDSVISSMFKVSLVYSIFLSNYNIENSFMDFIDTDEL
jgi:hypothetical protein